MYGPYRTVRSGAWEHKSASSRSQERRAVPADGLPAQALGTNSERTARVWGGEGRGLVVMTAPLTRYKSVARS